MTDSQARYAPSFSVGNKLFRIAWGIAWLLFARYTPPPLWAWRRLLLCAFGAEIGQGSRIYGSVTIWNPRNLRLGRGSMLGRNVNCYNQGMITIGNEVTVSWNAVLCSSTHEVEDPAFPLIVRPIEIGDNAWIAAAAFVGPGVRVGDGAVLGAASVAMRHLDPWTFYSGNPATLLRRRRQFGNAPTK